MHQEQFAFDKFPQKLRWEYSLDAFPRTRYQGSKRKLLSYLGKAFSSQSFTSILDLYSGSGMVSLLLRLMGKDVSSNDFLEYNRRISRLFLTSTDGEFVFDSIHRELDWLLNHAPIQSSPLVAANFRGIFFTDDENLQIDRFCQNIESVSSSKRDLYVYALGQALLMKRPFNLFHRANLNLRATNVKRTFGNAKTWQTPILHHMNKIVMELSKFPFPQTKNSGSSYCTNTMTLDQLPQFDAIYLDPPYLNKAGSSVDYADFYHFLEGLCEYRLFERADMRYAHRPIVEFNSAWNRVDSALDELARIANHWPDAILFLSYRNDGLPTLKSMIDTLNAFSRQTVCFSEHSYQYVLSTNKSSAEHIVVSLPSATEMSTH